MHRNNCYTIPASLAYDNGGVTQFDRPTHTLHPRRTTTTNQRPADISKRRLVPGAKDLGDLFSMAPDPYDTSTQHALLTKGLYGARADNPHQHYQLQDSPHARNPLIRLYGDVDRVPMGVMNTSRDTARTDQKELYTTYGSVAMRNNNSNNNNTDAGRFLTPGNLVNVHTQLERVVSDLVSQRDGVRTRIEIDPNGGLVELLHDHALRFTGTTNIRGGMQGAKDTLAMINQAFIDKYAPQYAHDTQAKDLNERYHIRDARGIRNAPYPEQSKSVRGEVVMDPSTLHLTHPHAKQHSNYLKWIGSV